MTQIRRSNGKIRGLGLAVFDGLLFPLLALDVMIVGGTTLGIGYYLLSTSPSGVPYHGPPWTAYWPLVLAAAFLALLIDYLTIRRVWRAVSAGGSGRESAPPGGGTPSPSRLTPHTEKSDDQGGWVWRLFRPQGPFLSRQADQIISHLTKPERKHLLTIELLYTGWVFFAIFGAPSLTRTIFQIGPMTTWALLWTVLLFASIPAVCGMVRHFLCSTEWARSQGMTPDQLRLFTFGAKPGGSGGPSAATRSGFTRLW